eukprot:CAMPEP_0178986566 /NCGR_PEP_ID=MMETSP0795-20121207/2771_1 /TAXON_ID=88552 /ORGANISM="Amoebophrya sp., Strain Ameob2" /LENGTH=547 /DNA_ID=CAMNT_0020677633 /DNA_START=196 /DNA_END=1839 /DNA_ORIENTATION=-
MKQETALEARGAFAFGSGRGATCSGNASSSSTAHSESEAANPNASSQSETESRLYRSRPPASSWTHKPRAASSTTSAGGGDSTETDTTENNMSESRSRAQTQSHRHRVTSGSGRSSSSSSSHDSSASEHDEILTYGAVTYVKDPNDNRSRRELKEVITEKLANEPLDSDNEEDRDLMQKEEAVGTTRGDGTLLSTAADFFHSAVSTVTTGLGATSASHNSRPHKPLAINDRAAPLPVAKLPTGGTTVGTGTNSPIGDANDSNSSQKFSSGQEVPSSLDGSTTSNNPKSLVIDESKLIGVQAPDGSSFLAYMKNYRSEFERISARILEKRHSTERRHLNPGTFFGMEHQTDGVLIDQMSDLEVLYARHQILFLCLLFLDFFVMAQYLYLSYSTGMELWGLRGNKRSMHDIYWVLFGVQLAFCVFYYGYGVRACYGRPIEKHEHMGKFCVAAIVGLVLMIFAEYVRKFNLFIFFLRLVMHLYSKFLITLNQHFFLSNSGSDVYQLLATQAAGSEGELSEAERGEEDPDLVETRQALMEIHRREAAAEAV